MRKFLILIFLLITYQNVYPQLYERINKSYNEIIDEFSKYNYVKIKESNDFNFLYLEIRDLEVIYVFDFFGEKCLFTFINAKENNIDLKIFEKTYKNFLKIDEDHYEYLNNNNKTISLIIFLNNKNELMYSFKEKIEL